MRPRLKKWSLCYSTLVAALCLAGSLVGAEPPCPAPPAPTLACPPFPSYMPGGVVPPERTTQPGMTGQPGTAETTFAGLGTGAGQVRGRG